jgi:hypothetical protein
MRILGTAAFLLAVAIAIGFAWPRRRGTRQPLKKILARPDLDAAEQRAQVSARYTLDPETTRSVLGALGTALAIPPRKLRLDDEFAALWDTQPQGGLHHRATFESWVLQRYPGLPSSSEPATVAQLVTVLQRLPLHR